MNSQTLRILIDLDACLRQAQLVRAHDGHRSGGRRQLGDRVRRQADSRSELDQELVQVERDVSVARVDAVPRLVLEHVHELLVRGSCSS